MRPTLAPDDYMIITKARTLRSGFVVLVNHPEYGVIVKRIKSIESDSLRLVGDGNVTTSTHEMGDVPTSNVIGRVRWAIKPKGKWFKLGLQSL